ncbi:MAG TPA: hypothetical protein VE869_16020 [Gemmatimonas sp.]|nr:hypothetical protein [Gemmatimonas sp.]
MSKRIRRAMRRAAQLMAAVDRAQPVPPTRTSTYWNGEPCTARRVFVRVGTVPTATWWCAGMEGTVRRAVEVTHSGVPFYLDNENGSGWGKVTAGRGSPWVGHASLPSDSVVVGMDERVETDR